MGLITTPGPSAGQLIKPSSIQVVEDLRDEFNGNIDRSNILTQYISSQVTATFRGGDTANITKLRFACHVNSMVSYIQGITIDYVLTGNFSARLFTFSLSDYSETNIITLGPYTGSGFVRFDIATVACDPATTGVGVGLSGVDGTVLASGDHMHCTIQLASRLLSLAEIE